MRPASPRQSRDSRTAFIKIKGAGSARARVGGSYGDTGALIVAVTERAVDGRATTAALRAIAAAPGVPRSAVTLLTGATSRDKVLLVRDPPADLAALLDALRG